MGGQHCAGAVPCVGGGKVQVLVQNCEKRCLLSKMLHPREVKCILQNSGLPLAVLSISLLLRVGACFLMATLSLLTEPGAVLSLLVKLRLVRLLLSPC